MVLVLAKDKIAHARYIPVNIEVHDVLVASAGHDVWLAAVLRREAWKRAICAGQRFREPQEECVSYRCLACSRSCDNWV